MSHYSILKADEAEDAYADSGVPRGIGMGRSRRFIWSPRGR